MFYSRSVVRAAAIAVTTLVPCAPNAAQGSRADYARADGLRAASRGKVLRADVRAHWLAGNDRFWYRHDERDRKRFVVVDAARVFAGPAFDHDKLASALSTASGKLFDGRALPFDEIEFVDGGGALRFSAFGYEWTCSMRDYTCIRGAKVAQARRSDGPRRGRGRRGARGRRRAAPDAPRPSPDGAWDVVVKDSNLYLKSKTDVRTFPLTHDGKADLSYGAATWSPDSKTVVAYRIEPGDVADVHLIETSPSDRLDAKLRTRKYRRPGDKFPKHEMFLFSTETKEGRKVAVEPIEIGYRGSPRLRWEKGNRSFTFELRDRGHRRGRVLRVNVDTGAVNTLIDERAATFIDHYHKHYLRFLGGGREILWASERDGWNHLYLYDAVRGGLKHQVTKGSWLVRGVDRVDEKKRQIWFRASGMMPAERDPYHVHHYRIDFDGENLVALTEGNGTHALAWSPDRRFYLDTYSRVDLPPVTELRRGSDGSLLLKICQADASPLKEATGVELPEVFHAKGRDGETDIWGLISRPSNFDPAKRYPVIEAIYAGPHDSHVPKSFRPYFSFQAVAELGFIVVKIDGMGTNNRSKAFHDVCWKNIGDAGFPDRILWMQAAAERYPYMDLSRVGIYGGSAGGQNAMGALLFHPKFYKVAVASCGCHDNRLDKASWNEQWMGYPVGPHYASQSNVTNAHKLEGKLFLIVGELDTNVPPESTYRVVDALIRADKDFDFLAVPGMGHGSGGTYGERRRRDFFVRHLLGVEPRWTAAAGR